jgi:hypothetical protein
VSVDPFCNDRRTIAVFEGAFYTNVGGPKLFPAPLRGPLQAHVAMQPGRRGAADHIPDRLR